MSSRKAQKPIFEGAVIALAGPLGGQWSDTNIARWVQQRKGIFLTDMNESVTHLICPKKDYKKCLRVQQATKRRNRFKCHLITLDWLEDSIARNRKLKEKPYLLKSALKSEREKRLKQKKEAKGNELAERFVNTNRYQVYTDETFFRYEVVLTRQQEEGNQEKYTLYLWESKNQPHLYHFASKFSKARGSAKICYTRPSETPQRLHTEFEKFKKFFKKKTGIEWDERLLKAGTIADPGKFKYFPPVGGKPVGKVPDHFNPHKLPESESEAKRELAMFASSKGVGEHPVSKAGSVASSHTMMEEEEGLEAQNPVPFEHCESEERTCDWLQEQGTLESDVLRDFAV